MYYIIIGILSFVLGFFIYSKNKNNITIGFSNKINQSIDGYQTEEDLNK